MLHFRSKGYKTFGGEDRLDRFERDRDSGAKSKQE
jgi:hypothetical protein